jgi:hypothetical protein
VRSPRPFGGRRPPGPSFLADESIPDELAWDYLESIETQEAERVFLAETEDYPEAAAFFMEQVIEAYLESDAAPPRAEVLFDLMCDDERVRRAIMAFTGSNKVEATAENAVKLAQDLHAYDIFKQLAHIAQRDRKPFRQEV